MAQVVGQRTTNQAITETRLIRQVDDEIGYLEPSIAPLITLMMGLQKRRAVKSPRIEWYEDDYNARWASNSTDTVNANASSTTFTFLDGTLFNVGTLFCIPPAVSASTVPEVCRVTAVSTNTITAVRNIGGTGLLALNDSAAVRLLGTAHEEGGTIPSALTTAPALKTNYCQIFRTVLDLSKTNIASEQYGASAGERKRLQDKKLKEHKIAMNAAALFGVKSESLSGGPNSKPIRTSAGLNSIISTNVYDAEGMLTQTAFESFARMSFRYGKPKKLLLACPLVISAVNQWAQSYLMVKPGETRLGVDIQEIITGHGVWKLVRDWSLENGVAGQSGFGGWAFSIDMDEASYRYLEGNGISRDTKLTENVVIDGGDRLVDEILTEGAFNFKQEKYHAKLFNVTSYSA